MLARNLGYRTVANHSNEFLDVALIADEGAWSTMLFDAEMVQKRREHCRDEEGFGIGNMLVCVILGRKCISVVVHAGIVDGTDLHAKWENRADGGNALHRTRA